MNNPYKSDKIKKVIVANGIKVIKDYSKHDHIHCFDSKSPACGQKIAHLKCCLCEEYNPEVESLRHSDREAYKQEIVERINAEIDKCGMLEYHDRDIMANAYRADGLIHLVSLLNEEVK